ncbi:MAG TPA: cyclic peptide export ABC transporter [Methylocella sp.]|nr:cyclic peptide export ABC transporter [Methylocella sp.]
MFWDEANRKQRLKKNHIGDDVNLASPWQLWRLFGVSKSLLLFSVLAGLISGGSGAGLMTLINRSIEEGQRGATALAPAFFGLCFLSLFSGALSITLLSRVMQGNLYELRLWLCRRILATPLPHIQSCGPHRIMAALTEDIGSMAAAQQALPHLLIQGSKLVVALLYLGFLSPSLLALLLVFVICGLFSWQLPQKWAWKRLKLARETNDALFGHFRALTEGYKELKLDSRRRHAFLNGELGSTADLLRRKENNANLMLVLADRWSECLYYMLIGTVVFLVASAEEIPRETLTGFVLVILFIGEPLSAVVQWVPAIGRGIVAFRNIEALDLSKSAELDNGSVAETVDRAGMPLTIELFDVSYAYPGDDGVCGYRLGPVDLHIAPGELIFVTGGNGSGKTTLALLILGLYAPDKGEIRFGGQLITNENRESYRQNFSAVFADSYVFDSLLGYSSGDLLARANELLALLQLDTKLHILNGRFSTVDLSRGQRKRLALLAAYLADRPYYLFDEWAAEQDAVFRDFFYLEMLPELRARGKTIIVITHDDRYFHLCDRQLRLDMGQIKECHPGGLVKDKRSVTRSSHV